MSFPLACADFIFPLLSHDNSLDVMKSKGYSGYFAVEYVWIDWEHCNEVDNISETILFRDFLCSRWT